MNTPTCAEIYDELLQAFADLSCDVCVLEALYRCRMALPAFATRAALSEELRRTRDFLEQHARDTETCGRFLLDRLAADVGMKKGPLWDGPFFMGKL